MDTYIHTKDARKGPCNSLSVRVKLENLIYWIKQRLCRQTERVQDSFFHRKIVNWDLQSYNLWGYPEEVAANKTVRLKSREQVASTQTELRDWNRWEPTELRVDQSPFSTDGDVWSHTEWAQVKVLKKPRLLGNRILQKYFHVTPAGNETAHLKYELLAGL